MQAVRLSALALLLFLSLPALQAQESNNLTPPPDLDPDVRALFEEAKAAYDEASTAQTDSIAKQRRAIELLHQVRRKERRFALPYYYLGILYQHTQEFEEARIALKKAVDLEPEFYQAWVELADVHVWLKRWDDSLPYYEQALEINPRYGTAYSRRAFALIRLVRYQDAKEDLRKAIQLAEDPKEKEGLQGFAKKLQVAIDGPDWEQSYTAETRYYLIKTPVSQEFADFIGEQAELIHKLYSSIFPSVRREDRKFVIIVYRSKKEYHDNGGPSGAGGHYNPIFRQLELFRYPKESDTLLVLYHEGFHQFLHDYLEGAPQWFNEGLADYFGPSEHIEGRGMRIQPNPWRLKTVKRAIRAKRHPSLYDLLHMTKAEMYNPKMAGIHYAQAWSFIHFLCEYDGRKYFPILKRYFKALRKGKGKGEAYDDSFGRVDMGKIEREWKKYVLELKG